MNIIISDKSSLAIYEQIIRQIKEAIMENKILPGEMLPSIRSLARDLKISVITTKRAYEELEAEGLIYAEAGKGFYVAQQNTDFLREKQICMLEEEMTSLIKSCRKCGLSREDMLKMLEELYEEG